MPREHFLNVEAPALLAAPDKTYDVPRWCTPKVARDHFVQVERALYSMPTRLIGRTLQARVDRTDVRFYDRSTLIRICRRLPPGGRFINPEDFPKKKRAYAMRDIEFLQKQADELGPNIGAYVRRLLSGPMPWTSMRAVHGIRGLAERHGIAVVDRCCATALAADMMSLKRLHAMVERDVKPQPTPVHRPTPPARFPRPLHHQRLRPRHRGRVVPQPPEALTHPPLRRAPRERRTLFPRPTAPDHRWSRPFAQRKIDRRKVMVTRYSIAR